jgi:hypothetical protein
MRKAAFLVVTLAAVLAGQAGAQTAADPVHVPRFEVGGQAALLFVAGDDGVFGGEVASRLTVNVTQRDAVEFGAGVLFTCDDCHALYLLQYKRVILVGTKRPDDRLFMTVGTGGAFYYEHYGEQRSPRPDGSVMVHPAQTNAGLDPPFLFSVGIGVERVVARYVASRGEAQVVAARFGGVGFRGMLGFSVPVGGHYVRPGQ